MKFYHVLWLLPIPVNNVILAAVVKFFAELYHDFEFLYFFSMIISM
jgi:hypothetical protein